MQQAKATVIEHRKVSDLLRVWEERVHKQAQHFDALAGHVVQMDTEIIANAAKVKALKTEHAYLKQRQDKADQSIQQIYEQQDALARLLAGLEESLRSKLPAEVAAAGDSVQQPRAHQRAKVLAVQLDELDRQTEDLAKETETVQSALYAEPLATVVRVLDAQSSALDAIQGQCGGLAQRLRAAEAIL